MKRVVFVVALGLLLCSCSNKVVKTEGKPYGVNMACADFGSNFPGVYNTDYTYPQASDLDYWNEKGLKLVRFPFKWERLQYELNGDLNRHDLDKMKDFVAGCKIKRKDLFFGGDIFWKKGLCSVRKRDGMVFPETNPFPMSV